MMMMMMTTTTTTTTMMMMTLMKLVNSATKFRHGMDKFYQPNSGLRGSRRDEAIYTRIYNYGLGWILNFSGEINKHHKYLETMTISHFSFFS